MSDIFDSVAAPFERMSLLAQLRDLVGIAAYATTPRCGGCDHWMKSTSCPREKSVNGWNRGPSMNDTPCDKYALATGHATIMREKCQEAVDFATKHGLPVPTHLLGKAK